MFARLPHPKGFPGASLLDGIVDAILDPPIRASHTATGARIANTLLRAEPQATRSDGIGTEAKLSPLSWPWKRDGSAQSTRESDFSRDTYLHFRQAPSPLVDMNAGGRKGVC